MVDHARFTPVPAHLERILRLLHRYYPDRSLSQSRNALAAMYGHDDWDALQVAIDRCRSPSAFDEDIEPEIVAARFQQQYDTVLAAFAGVTDESMLAAQALDQALFAVDRDSISKRYDPARNEKRVERARAAWQLAFARQAILEIRPSARESAVIASNREDIDLSYRIDLLPRALRSWLLHHRPLLRTWGERIGQMDVRQHCGTDLLDFSYCWGEICLDCNVEIPKSLQLYPVALGAKWFAWLTCSRLPQLKPLFAILHSERSADEERKRANRVISDALHDEEARFILAQPREDFRSHSASAREQHIHAGYALVRRWMSESATRSTVRDIMSRAVVSQLAPAVPGG